MAKRLNKKVALAGTAVLLILFVLFLVAAQQKDLFTSQAKLLADGDAAAAKGDYQTATKKYLRARARAKSNQVTLEALKRLEDVYLDTEDWPPLQGVWREILKIDPDNVAARFAILEYWYIIADGGVDRVWNNVETQATDCLDVVERNNLLKEDTARWEKPQYEKLGLVHPLLCGSDGVQRIGQYLYLLRGRARLSMASTGAVTEPDKVLEQAIEDLKKAQELEPTNTDIAWRLAQAFMLKGDLLASRGSIEERDKADKHALEVLDKAVHDSPEDVQARINKLATERTIAMAEDPSLEKLESFEPRYKELSQKFPQDARVHAFVSGYYRSLGPNYLDQCIAEIEKARQLDPNEVTYAVAAADSYSFKAVTKNDKAAVDTAVKLLNESLSLPGVQQTKGPRQFQYLNNRITVYTYLAMIYLERILNHSIDLSEQDKAEWLAKSEQAVHQIEQLRGSGEDPIVMKWQGMLALAKGDRTEAVQKLCSVYRQLRASDRMDTQLAYILAKAFEHTTELGAVNDFFMSALRLQPEDVHRRGDSIEHRWPSALLDEAQVLLNLSAGSAALNVVNYYERIFGPDEVSRKLRISALNSTGKFEEAQAALDEGGLDSLDRLRLESQLLQDKIRSTQIRIQRQRISEGIENPDEDINAVNLEPIDINEANKEAELENDQLAANVGKLVSLDPNSVSDSLVQAVCRRYRRQGQRDKAIEVANTYLRAFPDSVAIRTLVKVLDAGDKITDEQLTQIRKEVMEQISDPATKAATLGAFYAGQNEPNEGVTQFKTVLKLFEKNASTADDKLQSEVRMALSFLTEYVVQAKDWAFGEELIDVAQQYDLDRCNGDYIKARISEGKHDYDTALKQIEQCVEKMPVSSRILLLRGQIKQDLGRTDEAIADMKQATFFNPLDGGINRALAVALYKRNRALGSNVTTDQFIEVKEAIERAISTNKRDTELLSFYAEFISDTEPGRALAMRQRLFRTTPTVENAVLLANMASKLAQKQVDPGKKQTLIQIAATSYQKALAMDPANQAAVSGYADFCRAIGQSERADQLIAQSKDENLQWQYYLTTGQTEKAKLIMDKLYVTEPNNAVLLRGLLGVAQATLNQQDTKKYSAALCNVEGGVESKLIQVQAYLLVGLVSEAQTKLERLKEEYPDEPRAQFLNAALLLKQGKPKQALALANKGLETDQKNARGWLLRGEANRLLGNATQAISDLKKSESYENNPDATIALAQAYMAANRLPDAIIELRGIIDDPTAPDQGRLLLEGIYANTGDPNLLMSFYDRMMSRFPDNILWTNRAAALASQLKDYKAAQGLYAAAWKKTLEKGSGNADSLDGYMRSLVEDGKLQQALDVGAKYVDSKYAPIALVGIAMAKLKMNDRAAAIENFRMAADKAQDPAIAASVLGVMNREIGHAEVEKYCQEKLAQDSKSVVANYVLYRLARNAGDYNKAVGFLDKCISTTDPNSVAAFNLLVEKGTLLATAYEKYSDKSYVKEAIATFEKILVNAPDNADVLNNLAYFLVVDGEKLDLALQYAKKAVKNSPDNPEVLDTYAYVLYKNGRFEEAAENARASLQHYESQKGYAPSEVYEHLGMILKELGQRDEARATYEKALQFGKTLSKEKTEEINQAIRSLSN
jgi:tetratricopeptide (TPR) repeat protein